MILERIPKSPQVPQEHLIVVHIDHWSQMDYSNQIGLMGELRKRFPIAMGYYDESEVGRSVMEDKTIEKRSC
jgi:hypothetical protein